MGESVVVITNRKGYEEALEVSKDKPIVIDFHATWCGPCKMIAPKVEKYASGEYAEKAKFYKIDVDDLQDIAAENQVRAMPTFLIFKNKEKVETVVGANPKALEAALNTAVEAK